MTQVNIRPPTFALFASKPGELPDSYRRYLTNLLRDTFDLPGVPIRMMLRKGKNPYAGAGRNDDRPGLEDRRWIPAPLMPGRAIGGEFHG